MTAEIPVQLCWLPPRWKSTSCTLATMVSTSAMAPRPGSKAHCDLEAPDELTVPVATTKISPVHSAHILSLGITSPALPELSLPYPYQDSPGQDLCPRSQWARDPLGITEPRGDPKAEHLLQLCVVCGEKPTLVSTHQLLAHTGNLHVAKGLELAHLLCSDRVFPHGSVHGRAEEEGLAEVPGPDDTCL